MTKKFYVTTAIPYVNAAPHVGHALEYVQTDAIARWQKLLGNDVYYLTGTDDNALKNVQAAEEHGKQVTKYVRENSDRFEAVLKVLDVENDDFIRTTEKRHTIACQTFWKLCQKDIYKKKYKGLYCVGCETFYLEKDLIEGCCPEHKKPLEEVEEENYFFKLSSYQDWLEQLIESDNLRITPEFRKKEILTFIHGGLEDFSISRSVKRAKGWGIPVPDDPNQIIYVWFDALLNYITALGWPNGEKFSKYWPADVQVIGKGITRFHAIYWPAMLKSAGIEPPKEIFVHGYVTAEGEKISKSIGNVVDPFEEVKKYGVDAVRYYLLREIPAYGDGDYSTRRFEEIYNSELANSLGNLVSRLTKLAEGLEQPVSWNVVDNNDTVGLRIKDAYSKFKFDEVINIVNIEFLDFINSELNRTTPWKLDPKDQARTDLLLSFISRLLQGCAFLEPIMPETVVKIKNAFSGVIKPLTISLFPRIAIERREEERTVKNMSVDNLLPDSGFIVESFVYQFENIKVDYQKIKDFIKNRLEILVKEWDQDKFSNEPKLRSYQVLRDKLGIKSDWRPSAVELVQDMIGGKEVVGINPIVDLYDLVSLETLVSIGVHDLKRTVGQIQFKLTSGGETFRPIGGENIEVPKGLYAYCDNNGQRVICLLESKQSNDTKVRDNTKEVLVILEATESISREALTKAKKSLIEYWNKFFKNTENGKIGLVVGKVESIEILDDKSVQKYGVNIGSNVLQIICSDLSLTVGLLVPVALPGVKVNSPKGGKVKIKKSKVHGFESEAMMCSGFELGKNTDHQKIFRLDKGREGEMVT